MKPKKKALPVPDDPELRKIHEEIVLEKRAGTYWQQPRSKKDCKTLEDVWHYVSKLAHLDSRQTVLVHDGIVKRVVWPGQEFRDSMVDTVEELLPRVAAEHGLEEIRLVATKVSARGAERLRSLFPSALVTFYDQEDLFAELRLTSASFVPEDQARRGQI